MRAVRQRPASILFFLSGFAALVQEIVWVRWFALEFGQGPQALATVLTIHMMGLGMGSILVGRWTKRHNSSLAYRMYGFAEFGIGITGLLSVVLIPWGSSFYTLFPDLMATPLGSFALNGAFVFLVLFIPTMLMGASLPLGVHSLSADGKTINRVAPLYAGNIFGAACGAVTAGFFLIPTLGLRGSFLSSVVVNVLLAWAILGEKNGHSPTNELGEVPLLKKESIAFRSLVVFFLMGTASVAAEIIWTRALANTLGSTTYTFSLVIGLFLLGIGIGSWGLSKLRTRFLPSTFSQTIGFSLLALGVLITIPMIPLLPTGYSYVLALFAPSPLTGILLKALFISSVILPPTMLMGAAFPWGLFQTKNSSVEGAYGALCVGNAFGGVFAGLIFLPFLGIKQSLVGISCVYALGSLIGFERPKDHPRVWATVFIPCLIVISFIFLSTAWDTKTFSSGAYLYAPAGKGIAAMEDFWGKIRSHRLVFAHDGPTATVTVWKTPTGNPYLRINGKTDASTGKDMATQYFSAHLPALLVPGIDRKALVVGFGSGVTAGVLCDLPQVASVATVEIEPSVLEAGVFFSASNRRVLENKKFIPFVMDARAFLRSHPDKFDIITAEPSNLWISGMANLFTREAFSLYKNRLTPSGVFCQWVQGYGISEDDFRRVMATFSAVFPNATLFGSQNGDFFMIGSNQSWDVLENQLRRSYESTNVVRDLAPYGWGNSNQFLLNTLILSGEDFRRVCQGFRIQTDDNPFLEFSIPNFMGTDQSRLILEHLLLDKAAFLKQRKTSKEPAPVPPAADGSRGAPQRRGEA